MSKGMSSHERAIRIELARARAALERQELVHNAHELHDALRPAALWNSLLKSGGARQRMRHYVGWATRASGLSRRYPVLAAAGSTLLSGAAGPRRAGMGWRIGLALLLGWRLSRRLRKKEARV